MNDFERYGQAMPRFSKIKVNSWVGVVVLFALVVIVVATATQY